MRERGIADKKEALRKANMLASFLAENPRKYSAEINALDQRTGVLSGNVKGLSVALIHSGTGEGRACAGAVAKMLKAKMVNTGMIKLRDIHVPSEKLADIKSAQRLAEAGLREIREKALSFATRFTQANPGSAVEFNVAGGYKAQVAVLYELGRFLRVPVYYMHESYRAVIELP
jgi:putative CRISPR-associated protein (TIGR02619 family)